jgi:hypothetical protein
LYESHLSRRRRNKSEIRNKIELRIDRPTETKISDYKES